MGSDDTTNEIDVEKEEDRSDREILIQNLNEVIGESEKLRLLLPKNLIDRISEEDQKCAWKIYYDLSTRVTTEALPFRDGSEQGALDSLHKFFTDARELIKNYPGAVVTSKVAAFTLNDVIRPFTAKWHKLSQLGELKNNEARRREFRAELKIMQKHMLPYKALLHTLARAEVPDWHNGNPEIETSMTIGPTFDCTAISYTATSDSFPPIDSNSNLKSIDEVIDAELKERIRLRRSDAFAGDLRGLSLSGGGNRAASVSIGFIQGISQVFSDVDYLSSVSGGGYAAALVQNELNALDSDGEAFNDDVKQLFSPDEESAALKNARNFSNYLHRSISDVFSFVGMLLYGIYTNLLSIFIVAVVITLLFRTAELLIPQVPEVTVWSIFIGIGAIVILTTLFPLIDSDKRPKTRKRTLQFFGLVIALATATALLFSGGLLMEWVGDLFGSQQKAPPGEGEQSSTNFIRQILTHPNVIGAIVAAFIPAVFAFLSSLGKSKIVHMIFKWAVWLSQVVVIIVLIALVSQFSVFNPIDLKSADELISPFQQYQHFIYLGGVILVATILFFTININKVSPHRFYKNRLARSFLRRLKSDAIKPGHLSPTLSALKKKNAPYPIFNATVNVPSSTNEDLKGRRWDAFILSPLYFGSQLTGYYSATLLEEKNPDFDLASATAVSGAAFSPNMGSFTMLFARPWLAMLNIRLGYWLKKPETTIGKPPPYYLWLEMLGLYSENHQFLNISDGGHFENLGIYELLRRKTRFIVALDSASDGGTHCKALFKLMAYARSDLNIKIEIDTTPLKPNYEGISQAHFVVGKIHYPGFENPGWIIYVKSTITGDEPNYILSYRNENPSFPFERLSDQIFDEAQYEAYRALGEHMAEALFCQEMEGWSCWQSNSTLPGLVEMLARNYYHEDVDEGNFRDMA